VKKKIVLEGEFSYGFMGSAGSWYFRLGDEEITNVITNALEAQKMITKTEDGWRTHPRFTAGRVIITIEQVGEEAE
jgi:hypothetical protein